ncbi:MAG: hypothetical protein ACKVW3_07530 [Phycisphaerales bacterium]
MSRWEHRSSRDGHVNRFGARTLIRRSGRARIETPIEALEGRVLLAGDHPSFLQVFNNPTPATPTAITLDGTGAGQVAGTINPAMDDDVFQFTAPAGADFVTVWADGLNNANVLDSRVEIYTGTPGGTATLLRSSSNNGTLTSGAFRDGWVGFKATAGDTYYVRVLSDLAMGSGSTGAYNIRVDAIATAFPALNPASGVGTAGGMITLKGSDVVYAVNTGSGANFGSLAMITGVADAADLNTRIDIYDGNGNALAFDSDAGNRTNAFLAVRFAPSQTYYVRVRSDDIFAAATSTGSFTLNIDAIAAAVAIDPVTRLGASNSSVPSSSLGTLFRFKAQGSGFSWITVNAGAGLAPIPDSAVRLYSDAGVQIAFNELPGPFSQIITELEGGKDYFVIVENFDGSAGGTFALELEVHHTINTATGLDDHQDFIAAGTGTPPVNPTNEERKRGFELATPLIWGAPEPAPSPFPAAQFGNLNPAVPVPPHHVQVVRGFAQGRIETGGDTDIFQFVPPVDMLGDFSGNRDERTVNPMGLLPPIWEPKYRPSTRLQIKAIGGTLENTRVRVFDSKFNQVYPGQNGYNNTTLGGFLEPSGVIDPASLPPTPPFPGPPPMGTVPNYSLPAIANDALQVWGGEVYYLEISSEAGAGRYNVEVQVDADADTSTTAAPAPVNPDVSKFSPRIAEAGEWANAYELQIDPNTGDAVNYVNAAGGALVNLGFGFYTVRTGNFTAPLLGRGYSFDKVNDDMLGAGMGADVEDFVGTAGSRGRVIFQLSDLGNLTSATDADLFQFRALYTGTAEVRVNTTDLADEFWEGSIDTEERDLVTQPPPPPTPIRLNNDVRGGLSKTYDSPLDSALRVFRNDFTEIAYNNDNSVTAGESDTTDTGEFVGKTFQRRDARVTFPVVAGNTYFLQVESGQRQNFSLTFPKVDWRHATGSYELLVNSMPFNGFDDDHINPPFTGLVVNPQATPIPVDLDTTSTSTTLGSVDGEIALTPGNPADADLFQFLAPATGTMTISADRRAGDAFSRRVSVYDGTGNLIAQSQVSSNTGTASVNILTNQGERFYVAVDGAGQQGRYTVSLQGAPFSDDHASEPNLFAATDIPSNSYDYDGTETVSGSIESAGDTDVFTFSTIAYDTVSITVDGITPTLRPSVFVYEISEDPSGHPVLLIVGFGGGNGATSTTITVALTAPPRTSTMTNETFNNYFVVIGGIDPNVDFGDYNMTLDFNVTTDDHPDGPNPPPPGSAIVAGQFDVATLINLGTTGTGGSAGMIELTGDSDLFTFTSQSQGTATINVISTAESLLFPRVRVIDENGLAVFDSTSNQPQVTGPDAPQSIATYTFTAQRNAKYFVMIEGAPATGNTFKTSDSGRYLVNVGAPTADDHPNISEFSIADPIVLSTFSGVGAETGVIEVTSDSDLFRVDTLVNGNLQVTIDTPGSGIRPVLRFFDFNEAQVGGQIRDGDALDEDGLLNGSVTRTYSTLAARRYYVLISSDPTTMPTSGSYAVAVFGGTPPPGPDDHANAGDFANATLIPLNARSGDGNATGLIELGGDTDLFVFNSLSGSTSQPRTAYINIVKPGGQLPDRLGLRVFGPNLQLIAQDTVGTAGVEATIAFSINAPNQKYYVEVDGLAGLTGAYSVRIDTAPETFFLYYPEGFSSARVREYVSIGNANNHEVNYTIRLRYEGNDPETVIVNNGTIAANSRGGITISNGPSGALPGVLLNRPYAIVVESDGFLAANISHYDFGNTLGEAFTGEPSTQWSFARGTKFPGSIQDFLVYYNPNPSAAVVTLTAYYPNGQSVAFSQTVQGNRRLGWNFNDTPMLQNGEFSFVVTSAPANPADEHIGIVAALSHYDLDTASGYAVLGDADGGATSGVIPGIQNQLGATTNITFFNNSNTATTIGLVGKYVSSGLPDLVRPISIGAFERLTFTPAELGLVADQAVGLRYDASTKITVLAETVQFNDSDATQGANRAGTSWFVGDAFINRNKAGTLYFETAFFYNPTTDPLNITLDFIYRQGTVTSHTFTVGAKDFQLINLHQLPAVLNSYVFNYFAVQATASAPFVMSMNHYDLVLQGGWSTKGAPLGLTEPITNI